MVLSPSLIASFSLLISSPWVRGACLFPVDPSQLGIWALCLGITIGWFVRCCVFPCSFDLSTQCSDIFFSVLLQPQSADRASPALSDGEASLDEDRDPVGVSSRVSLLIALYFPLMETGAFFLV